jgi:hypothetical protein
MRAFLVAMTSAFLLSGCVSSTDTVVRDRPIYPAIPVEARRPCPAPVLIPTTRALTEERTFTLWSEDRAALVACETRRAAAVAAATEPRP